MITSIAYTIYVQLATWTVHRAPGTVHQLCIGVHFLLVSIICEMIFEQIFLPSTFFFCWAHFCLLHTACMFAIRWQWCAGDVCWSMYIFFVGPNTWFALIYCILFLVMKIANFFLSKCEEIKKDSFFYFLFRFDLNTNWTLDTSRILYFSCYKQIY